MVERWQIILLLDLIEEFLGHNPSEVPNLSGNMALVELLYSKLNDSTEPRIH